MTPLVRLQGVSKIYPRVHKPWERMKAFNAVFWGRESTDGARVLHDIDLEVWRGQSLGVIGENGAGKSTLLKVLTGVIQPTTGTVQVNTKTAALLELGAGFQPDFSGLENVRMKASLLGMGRAELNKRLDYILDFADIGEYIHEPVKHYSSGMVVRLGFAVVAASSPELLITDEVLAVGDESFQKKCIQWLENFRADGGTLLLVSHSMFLVQKLCQHAIWLQDGGMRASGEVFDVTQQYLAWHESNNARHKARSQPLIGAEGLYRVQSLEFDSSGDQSGYAMGEDLVVELTIFSPDGRPPVALIGIVRADGTPIYGIGSDQAGVQPQRIDEHLFRFRLCFHALALLPGSYSVRGHAMDPEGMRVFDTMEQTFRVTGSSREMGFLRLSHEWLDG
jgi:lipopolysaccharide transport system ATP-binding protein